MALKQLSYQGKSKSLAIDTERDFDLQNKQYKVYNLKK